MITEVTINIKRDKGEVKSYKLTEIGDSKKGTFKTFGTPAENADMPSFVKLYIKAEPDKAPKAKK